MASNQLLHTLKTNRINLPEELKKDYRYDSLQKKLLEIEQNEDNMKVIRDLFLGQIGIESNKQLAFYELPTYELLTIIKCITQFIGINNIEEIGSGIGLLASMLKHHDESLSITASDGNRWIETSGKKYYDISSKLFLEYCINNAISFDNKILLISWIPKMEMPDFIALITKKKPKYVIIIGDILNTNSYNGLYTAFHNLNYKFCGIPAKQICYRDSYLYNNITGHSSTLFATCDNNLNLTNLLTSIKEQFGDCLANKVSEIADISVLRDVIIKFFDRKFLLENLNEQTCKYYVKELYFLLQKKIKIPEYIRNYDEYKFWFDKIKHKMYPHKINDRSKFIEYKGYMDILNNNDGLNELKNIGVLSDWVSTVSIAEKFIFNEFSSNHKQWKVSRNSMTLEFQLIHNRGLITPNFYNGLQYL